MTTDCELIQGCIFFNNKMQNMPATAELLKKRYCKGAFSTCARHMVFKAMGRPRVPPDLFPQQTEIAEDLIRKG
jgi:hypothetical protein